MFNDLENLSYEERTRIFADPEAAREYVEAVRWPDGAVCPHCGVEDQAYRIKGKSARPGLWKCRDCRKQFTVTVGTIFERSHVGLHKWLHAIHSMCASKKGISAKQLERELGVTYKTAWFMCHRVRKAMEKVEPEDTPKIGGIVEVDETYVGGKGTGTAGGPMAGGTKMPVFSMVSRDGEARSYLVDNVKAVTLQGHMLRNIEGEAHIMTDEMHSYWGTDAHFQSHGVVKHSKKEYVRGIVHTNFAESFFSLVKRAIMGAFHHVSKQHMQRYLEEFDWRWNTRKLTDTERMVRTIRQAGGRRLYYRVPKSAAALRV